MEPLLVCSSLSRDFTQRSSALGEPRKLRAVNQVDLEIHAGETLGLVGESGCGKSTLARLVTGLLQPTSGDIRLLGEPLWRKGRLRNDLPQLVQMVFQDPQASLNPRQRVAAAVVEGLAVQGVSRKERKERAAELLQRVGLDSGDGGRYPHQFSGGQRQRIAIARALALSPKMLVLDEPVSALDVSVQAQILSLLQELVSELGLTCLFISHDLAVIGHLCDRVAVMYLGDIVETGPTHELMSRPLHPYTKALMEAAPVFGQKRHSQLLPGEAPSAMENLPGCPFHTRCPRIMALCTHDAPDLAEVAPGRLTACHLYK